MATKRRKKGRVEKFSQIDKCVCVFEDVFCESVFICTVHTLLPPTISVCLSVCVTFWEQEITKQSSLL